MTHYVVGFRFTEEEEVVLIKKNRPKWQRGFLNGVGGHVEPGESAIEAMIREFQEEADFIIVEGWDCFCTLKSYDYKVDFFRSFGPFDGWSFTDEEIIVIPITQLPQNVLPNLRWLIPMALDYSITKGIIT